MKQKLTVLLSFLLCIGLLVGCSENEQNTAKDEPKDATVSETGFPVIIKDGAGKEITIEKKPSKIVSLIPSNTEIIYALGADEKIVGVSDWDNYPEDVKTKEKIGGQEFNVEKIISLKPDLVLGAVNQINLSKQGFDQLENAGIQVFLVDNAASFKDVYQSIIQIGNVIGTNDKAEDLVKTMKDKVQKIQEKGEKIKEKDKSLVWIEINPAPDLYTAAKGTFINEMLEMIGAKNAAGDMEGWPQVSEEDAVLLNPDVIITTYGDLVENSVEQVLNRDAWQSVPAIKNKRVYDVDTDLMSRAGPRLVEGVEELAKTVYPDIYK